MSRSASLSHRVYVAVRPIAERLFAIPLLGYGLRIIVGILKLPRFNMHLRRLDQDLRKLENSAANHARFGARIAPLDARVAALEALYDRVAALEPLDARVAALEPVDARVTALEGAWRQHVPAFLNAVGTVSAFANELVGLRKCLEEATARLDNGDASMRAIWDRIEFVRREILFEMAHGNGGMLRARGTKVATRINAHDKVAVARENGALRLNLGCGHIALPGYVNVDVRDLPSVDVVAEVGDLPFESGSVDEIFSAHLMEHFPQEAIRRRLLPYWHNLLRSGGVFRAITPDAAAMLAGAGAGTYDFEDFREVVFGGQDYVGDYHYNLFTPDSLRRLLEEAGFNNVEVPIKGRRNGKCFEFEISARRV